MHAYFDCFSGISGDMTLGAFVDMGVPVSWLVEQVDGLCIGNVEISVQEVKKSGIGARQITIEDKTAAHQRNYADILNLIDKSDLGSPVKKTAASIFGSIAEAEARIHRCEKESVHFHEVGAVDSIVDIVGTALCLDYFSIESVSSSPLPLGSGFVDCAHGKLPVPAPATLELLKGLPVYGTSLEGELITPTGAGIIATISENFGPMPRMEVDRIGYGSGSRDHQGMPNLLRILIGQLMEQHMESEKSNVCVMETNIDDMNPELLGYLIEKLFRDGALDVCLVPVIMKKNRPGTKVEILCPPEKKDAIAACLFSETSTIGLRYQWVHRHILKRSLSTVATCFGDIQVKCTTDPEGRKRCAPEYECCRKLAIKHNIPLKVVYEAAARAVYDGMIRPETVS